VFSVNVQSSSHPKALSWRELYTAALFETDKNRMPARIADAEQAIVSRARELFSAGNDTIEEDQALQTSGDAFELRFDVLSLAELSATAGSRALSLDRIDAPGISLFGR
jgi:hypothetical protein